MTGEVNTFPPAAGATVILGQEGVVHFETLPKNMNEVTMAQTPILGDTVTGTNTFMPLIWTLSPNKTAGFRDTWLAEIKEDKNKTCSCSRL